MTKSRFCIYGTVLSLIVMGSMSHSGVVRGEDRTPRAQARLMTSFQVAAEEFAGPKKSRSLADPSSQIFLDALSRSKLPHELLKKVADHLSRAPGHKAPTFNFSPLPLSETRPLPFHLSYPVALHMTRLDVVEDYDDVNNDNVFIYSVSTYGDLTWGRVSPLMTNLDEGQSALIPPNDQGIFGPRGQFHVLERPLIVDFGIIESDAADIVELRELSRIIVEAAAIAFAASEPSAGPLIRSLRDETNELLAAVASLDGDDRLVTTSMTLDPIGVAGSLGQDLSIEIPLEFRGERNWSRFGYRLWFRLLRE